MFTLKLLIRIGLKESTPLWWLFLGNFAPILAARIVALVIMTAGSAASGGAERSVQKSLFDTGLVMEAVRGAVDGVSAWTGGIAAKYLSFILGKDAFSLTMFLCFLFGGIGMLAGSCSGRCCGGDIKRRGAGRPLAGSGTR